MRPSQRISSPKVDARTDAGEGGSKRRARGSIAVHEDLREDILCLRLAPGSPLDEIALGERFGLSRTPIREALLMLAAEDLVTFMHGRSPFVAPLDLGNTAVYMDTLMLMSRAVASLASELRTSEAMQSIRDEAKAYEAAAGTGNTQAIAIANLNFHRAVSFSTRNPFLGKFYRLSLDYGRRMNMLHYYPLFDDEERKISVAQHGALADAIEARDARAAVAIAGEHVSAELRVIQRSLEPDFGARFPLRADAVEP